MYINTYFSTYTIFGTKAFHSMWSNYVLCLTNASVYTHVKLREALLSANTFVIFLLKAAKRETYLLYFVDHLQGLQAHRV